MTFSCSGCRANVPVAYIWNNHLSKGSNGCILFHSRKYQGCRTSSSLSFFIPWVHFNQGIFEYKGSRVYVGLQISFPVGLGQHHRTIFCTHSKIVEVHLRVDNTFFRYSELSSIVSFCLLAGILQKYVQLQYRWGCLLPENWVRLLLQKFLFFGEYSHKELVSSKQLLDEVSGQHN